MRVSAVLLSLLAGVAVAKHHNGNGPRRHHANNHGIEQRNGTESSHSLSKRAFTGTGTFFYVGLGACGQWSQDSDSMVALNSAQYGGGYPGPQCFKSITIQANGKTQVATIMDECPTCGYGSLDLSPSLFRGFADESAGVVSITWWFNDGSEAAPQEPKTSTWVAPTSEWHAPTSTTPAWTPDPTSTSTYVYVAPSSSSTSQWVAPSSSTSQWVAPSSSSSVWVAPSSSSTLSSSTSISASSSSSSSRAAFFQSASVNGTAVGSATGSASAPSASADADSTDGSAQTVPVGNNLVFLNVLTAQFGGLVVMAAEV